MKLKRQRHKNIDQDLINQNKNEILMNMENEEEEKKILVVDDEKDICFLLKGILKRETDAKIEVAYSFEEAKSKLRLNRYHLVFFDVRLGNENGLDLVKYIDTLASKTFVTMISAYNSSADLEKMKDTSIDQFLPKPLSRDKIIECIKSASL